MMHSILIAVVVALAQSEATKPKLDTGADVYFEGIHVSKSRDKTIVSLVADAERAMAKR